MPLTLSTPFARYAAAAAAVAAATALRVALAPVLGESSPYPIFFLAVAFAARGAGTGPGVASIVLSAIAAVWFVLPPGDRLVAADFVGLGLFVGLAGGVVYFAHSAHAGRARADALAAEADARRTSLEAEAQRRADEVQRRTEAEDRARRAEDRLRLAADVVPGVVYDIDIATGVVWRSRGLERVLGYDPDAVPPTRDWWLSLVHPDDAGDCAACTPTWSRAGPTASRTITGSAARTASTCPCRTPGRSCGTRPAGRRGSSATRPTRPTGGGWRPRPATAAGGGTTSSPRWPTSCGNPLAPIRTSLQILQTGRAGPDASARALAVADRQLQNLVRLIDDVADVSRAARGEVELVRQPADLDEIVRRAVEAARPEFDARGHALEFAAADAPLPVDGDAARLAQAVGHLLHNAAKFTPPGGRVRVAVARADGEAAVTVADNGVGIAADQVGRVFEPFVQEHATAERRQGGLGIGLTLARSLVELHGGRLDARSGGRGLGAEFVVRLPVAAGPRPAAKPAEPERPPAVRGGRRVLIVDDNRDAATSLAELVRTWGHEPGVAHDGPDALGLAATFSPHVVLLDIGLPGLDGYEVARRLRERPVMRDVKLVALTGYGQEADRRRSREAGFDLHLVKPVDPDRLRALLATW